MYKVQLWGHKLGRPMSIVLRGHTLLTLIVLASAIASAPSARSGEWGEPWGELLWGPRPQEIAQGLVLYAPTAELPGIVTGCFDLLMFLGGPVAVESITGLNSTSQQTFQCAYEVGTPIGVDFGIVLGAAFLVKLKQPKALPPPGPPKGCPATSLDSGVNLIGVGRPMGAMTC